MSEQTTSIQKKEELNLTDPHKAAILIMSIGH